MLRRRARTRGRLPRGEAREWQVERCRVDPASGAAGPLEDVGCERESEPAHDRVPRAKPARRALTSRSPPSNGSPPTTTSCAPERATFVASASYLLEAGSKPAIRSLRFAAALRRALRGPLPETGAIVGHVR